MDTLKRVLRNTANSFKHLKALFTNKLQVFIFVLLAIAYMVSTLDHIHQNLANSLSLG